MKLSSFNGKPYYINASLNDPFDINNFHEVSDQFNSNIQYACHTDIGSLTVLDRMTGFGCRDVETAFRDNNNRFWLTSGNQDVRYSGAKTLGEAIEWVKNNKNTWIQPDND
jgi:hypothetical protein